MLRGALQWFDTMTTFRRWHLLVLVGLMIDLVNPTMPGIFSLSHGDLFMDGVTRAHGSVPGTTSLRDHSPARPADRPAAAVSRGEKMVPRDTRRADTHPDQRRSDPAPRALSAADTEDH
jgi:hypothetical protein